MYARQTVIFRTFSAARCAISALVAASLLGGCTPASTGAFTSLRQIFGGSGTDMGKLDPNFAYLRITRGRHVGLVWRGSVERSPAGPVEVYFSSAGEVIRLREGRLVEVLGLPAEWRQVADPAPAWSVVLSAREPVSFVRVRDVMPGYRSGVRDELQLRRTTAPERSALRGIDPHSLTWFEEHTQSRGFRLPGTPSDVLPPARYALDLSGAQPMVVYSEQCLVNDFCFTWQRWSAVQEKPAQVR